MMSVPMGHKALYLVNEITEFSLCISILNLKVENKISCRPNYYSNYIRMK
jgi:hypothetical protein